MLAGMAAARINAALGLEESAAAIFRHRTVVSLAAALGQKGIDNKPAPVGSVIPRTPYTQGSAGVPLSPKQQYWLDLTQQLQADYPTFHIPIVLNLTGSVNVSHMQSAFDLLAAKHESLRLHIADGRQVVNPGWSAPLTLRVAAGPGTSLVAQPTADKQWLQEQLKHLLLDPFDFTKAPLARAALLQVCVHLIRSQQ